MFVCQSTDEKGFFIIEAYINVCGSIFFIRRVRKNILYVIHTALDKLKIYDNVLLRVNKA